MKTSSSLFLSTLVVAIAGFVSTAAFAQDVSPSPEISGFVSQKTRAEVRAEALQAIAEHRLARNESEYQHLANAGFVSTKSRVQVVAEMHEAARLGLIPRNESDRAQVTPTAEQLRLVEQAGERARSTQIANR